MSEVKTPFDPAVLERDLRIDHADLNAAFMAQASLYSYYAARHSSMLSQEDRLKLKVELVAARLDKAIRDRAASSGTKITEKQIEAEIALSPDYVAAIYAYNEAKAMTRLAAGAVEAFRQRRDMLIQIGANDRQEMKGELVMRRELSLSPEALDVMRRHT